MNKDEKTITGIVNISVRDLYPHPKNPRKDLGDLTELTESIKKNGIMQNLTVIPGRYDEDAFISEDDSYTVIIGHRRLEAAKAAGLKEVPCRVAFDLSENDQIAMMLEENMQRNDLTVYEQAQSFQLMLDLGETVDTLSEKTGFARSTIYHRLNIAKLDPEVLKDKTEDDYFQMTLTDLIELEKVESVETRNRILKESTSSRDIKWKVDQAARAEAKEKKLKKIRAILGQGGMEEVESGSRWHGYETIYEYAIDGSNDFEITEELRPQLHDDTVFEIGYNTLYILNPTEDEDDDDDRYSWKQEQEERNRRNDTYNTIEKQIKDKTRDFIIGIIDSKYRLTKKEDHMTAINKLVDYLFMYEGYGKADIDNCILFWKGEIDEDCKEEYQAAIDEFYDLPTSHKLLIWLGDILTDDKLGLMNWEGRYQSGRAKVIEMYYDVLALWGWTFTEEEEKLIDGTHEIYVEEEYDDDYEEEDEDED